MNVARSISSIVTCAITPLFMLTTLVGPDATAQTQSSLQAAADAKAAIAMDVESFLTLADLELQICAQAGSNGFLRGSFADLPGRIEKAKNERNTAWVKLRDNAAIGKELMASLKNYYAMWITSVDETMPESGDSRTSYERRNAARQRQLKQMANAIKLDL